MNERALVVRAQSGDRNTCDELLRSIQRPMHRYIAAIVPSSADDVLQDVFIRIVRNLRWLKDPALFRAWAYRIASREAFRALRKLKRNAEEPLVECGGRLQPAGGGLKPASTLDDPWVRERLMRETDRLPPASRAVVLLHYFEDMTLVEVAAILDVSLGTVKSRLAYGLALLRKELV